MNKALPWSLVTGGAKGLGAEICLTLAKQGFPVLVHYRSSHREAADIVKICRQYVPSEKIQGDFSNSNFLNQFNETLHQQSYEVGNLINNVGTYLVKPTLNYTQEDLCKLFQSNLFAPYALIQSLIPSLKKFQGNIINIGVAGINSLRADTYSIAYTMAKLSLGMLTRSLAKELAASFVKVNMVSPGYLENAVDLPKEPSSLPMKRPAVFKEVADIIAFLLKEENSYVTGQNIEIAGGVRL